MVNCGLIISHEGSMQGKRNMMNAFRVLNKKMGWTALQSFNVFHAKGAGVGKPFKKLDIPKQKHGLDSPPQFHFFHAKGTGVGKPLKDSFCLPVPASQDRTSGERI